MTVIEYLTPIIEIDWETDIMILIYLFYIFISIILIYCNMSIFSIIVIGLLSLTNLVIANKKHRY